MTPKLPIPLELLQAVRQLRSNTTPAEERLWAILRRKQIAGFRFRRQHPIPPFVVDFYCHEAKLAIEVDGGYHSKPEVRRRDGEREDILAEQGIRVLRFTNEQVTERPEDIVQRIWQALQDS